MEKVISVDMGGGKVVSNVHNPSPCDFFDVPVSACWQVEHPLLWSNSRPFDFSHPTQETKYLSYVISQNREVYDLLTGRLMTIKLEIFHLYVPLTGVRLKLKL